MKIAVFHELPNEESLSLINELSSRLKKIHAVDLYKVSETKNKNEDKYYSKTFFYKFAPINKYENINGLIFIRSITGLIRLFKLHKKIAFKINHKKYDLVIVYSSRFTHSPFILRFIKTKKIYYMFTVNEIFYRPVFKFLKREYPLRYILETLQLNILKLIDKINVKGADRVLAGSKNTADEFYRFYGKKAFVCYPGVDCDFFKPGKRKDIDLLFVGSLDWKTGEFALFKSSLNFVKNKVNVKVVSRESESVSDRQILDLYQRSKIIICTDKNESLGAETLEAASCGVPAIAVKTNFFREIISQNSGLLVGKKPEAIAKAIDYLIQNPNKIQRLGMNARENILKYRSWDQSILTLNQNIKEVLNPLY